MLSTKGRVRWCPLLVLVLSQAILSGGAADAQDGCRRIAKGVVHRWWTDPAGPWAIHVLEVDLTAGGVSIVTAKAGDRLAAREKTSEMARRLAAAGLQVLAAVNADFFTAEGVPVGLQVIRGMPLREPTYRSVFGITERGKPFISPLAMRAWVAGRSGWRQEIERINRGPLPDELVLYHRYAGPEINLPRSVVVSCFLLDSLRVQRDVRLVCAEIDSSRSRWRIDGQHVLLVGRGRPGGEMARACAPGDTLVVRIDLWPEQGSLVVEAVGGLPRIVRHGRISIETDREGGSESFRNSRHPRTAVGITSDGRKVLFVTVDGRQPGHSVGMTLRELASLMLKLGAYEALNLDGGGSTTMVVSDSVVNRPSDATGERPVANALLVVSGSQRSAQRTAVWPEKEGIRRQVRKKIPPHVGADPAP